MAEGISWWDLFRVSLRSCGTGKRDFGLTCLPHCAQRRHMGEESLGFRPFLESFLWFAFTEDSVLIFVVWGSVAHRSLCAGNKRESCLPSGLPLPSSQFRGQEGISQVHFCLVWFKLFKIFTKDQLCCAPSSKRAGISDVQCYYAFLQPLCSPKHLQNRLFWQWPLQAKSSCPQCRIYLSPTQLMLREFQSLHNVIIILCKAVSNCQVHFIYIEVWEKHN